MKNNKDKSNNFGYAEVVGTCLIIISSALLVSAILIVTLSTFL